MRIQRNNVKQYPVPLITERGPDRFLLLAMKITSSYVGELFHTYLSVRNAPTDRVFQGGRNRVGSFKL